MIIVPIGKLILQEAETENREEYLRELIGELHEATKTVIQRCIEAEIEREVTQGLQRKAHGRSKRVNSRVTGAAVCRKCGSQQVSRFWRNGHYRRGLDTSWGHVRIAMPQVRCRCGGSVAMPWRTVRKGQRIWEDLTWEMQAEYGWGLSLRWIKAKEDGKLGGSLGLRTINERVRQAGAGREAWLQRSLSSFPPVVEVDGVWITLMKATAEKGKDRLGRWRQKKVGQRYVILFARGCWPQTGQRTLLTWLVAEKESDQSWGDLLFALKQMKLRTPGRWDLLIGDGAGGLEAARQIYCPDVPLQRCIFHKLRNLLRDLTIPDSLDRLSARAYRRTILDQARLIWQAEGEPQAWQRYHAFCKQWNDSQPKAVRTLQRDFERTLAFFHAQTLAQERGEDWPLTHLRTTSHLERENRNFRRRLRQAVLFHSQDGLEAAVFQNHILRETLPPTS
jgi:transposase-like protein